MTPPPESAVASPSTSRLLRRMLGFVWRYRGASLLVLALNVVLVVFNLGGLGLAGLGIDVLRSAVSTDAPPVHWPGGWTPPSSLSPKALIGLIAAAVLGIAAVHGGLKFLTAIASAYLSQRMLHELRAEVYDKLQRLGFKFFDEHDSSSIIGRVAGDVQAVRAFADGVVLKVLTVALSLLVYMAYMLWLHVPLTIACLASSPLLWVGAVWFSKAVRPMYLRSSELSDRMIATLVENVQGIQVVKGFAREPEEIAKFAVANEQIQSQKSEIFSRLSLYQPTMGFLTQVNQIVLIAYGGYLVIHGNFPLGAGMFVFANLIQEFAGQVGQIVNIANSIQASLAASERVFEILDAPLEIIDDPAAIPLTQVRGNIGFEHVTFGYVPGTPVLRDISLTIRAGERIGIVGSTGSGKTTLLALIARFHDVQHGRVTIDGHDVRALRLNDLRRSLGLVFQESFLFSNTVGANIAFGRPRASAEEIEQAARLADAAEFVDELTDRYESLVGEHGANLSGGQRQRLAIARALLLDPPILLLDDATAAVDAETEHEIQSAIQQAMQDRTTLIVSSRVSTLKQVDRIYVLKAGSIIEWGTHAELMKLGGEYRRLARLQFLDETVTEPST